MAVRKLRKSAVKVFCDRIQETHVSFARGNNHRLIFLSRDLWPHPDWINVSAGPPYAGGDCHDADSDVDYGTKLSAHLQPFICLIGPSLPILHASGPLLLPLICPRGCGYHGLVFNPLLSQLDITKRLNELGRLSTGKCQCVRCCREKSSDCSQ